MKKSVVIPCVARHFRYLDRALDSIVNQTVRPDEVIVSLCQASLITQDAIDNCTLRYSQIFNKFNLLCDNELLFHGPNRQKASELCSGDIIIYQDADDVSHRQRIEVLTHFFEKTDAVHIAHTYKNLIDIKDYTIDVNKINVFTGDKLYNHFFPSGNIKDCLSICIAYAVNPQFGVHGGAIALRRKVLNTIHWKHPTELKLLGRVATEDYEFDMDVLYTFKKSILIDAPIYFYNTSDERFLTN